MNERILEAMKREQITSANINFDLIRQLGKLDASDPDIYPTLNFGQAVLQSSAQLEQYMHSYAPMTRTQWHELLFLGNAALENALLQAGAGVTLTDYGCGQGLGTALFFDHLQQQKLKPNIRQLLLIEPSAVALHTARHISRYYMQRFCSMPLIRIENQYIKPVQLDWLGDHFKLHRGRTHVHILSNVLDLKNFPHDTLFKQLRSIPGSHILLAASSARHKYPSLGGIHNFKRALRDLELDARNNRIHNLQVPVWSETLHNETPCILFQAHFEVR